MEKESVERDCIDAEDGESLPKALDGGEFAVDPTGS